MNQNEIEADPPLEDNPVETADSQTEVERLRTELDELKAELEQVRADTLRERADLENQRKRVTRDVELARRFANERLLSDLLPVFDSIDAGLSAAGDEESPLKDGLILTYKQLMKAVSDHGLTVLDPAGEAFDPELHQAVSQIDSEEAESGDVVQVFQKGYRLNDRLLRPALVIVAS